MSNEFWQTIGDFVAAEMRGAEQERERIIKLLENHRISLKDISTENWVGLWHDAVKKIKESTNE